MLEGNFLEDFSADCLHPGDKGAAESSWEVLDLRADSRECLAEAGSLEASGSFPTAMAFGCWEPGAWEPFSALSSTALLQTDLMEPPRCSLLSSPV